MRGVRAWLPLPLWVVVVMFVVGVGAGVGLALVVTQLDEPGAPPAPWKDQHTSTLPPPAAPGPDEALPPADAPQAEQAAPEEPEGSPGQEAEIAFPPARDARRLANMINSPVRRALENALERLDAKVSGCRQELGGLSGPLDVRIELESLGGMATVTEVEFYHAQAVAAQDCLLKKTSQLLIAFPVEDGRYEVIHRFAVP